MESPQSLFILGVSGGSGSGKTTFAKRLAQKLGPDKAVIIAQDNYYIDQSHRFDGDGGSVNFDHPDSLDFKLMAKHLSQLKKGHQVEVPIYDFKTHTRLKQTIPVAPRSVVIVDGILLLSQPHVREHFFDSVFVDVPENVRFERRLKRDVEERGRTPEGVKKQFENQVKPMHDLFVEPSKAYAGHVITSLEEFDIVLEQFAIKLSQKFAPISETLS